MWRNRRGPRQSLRNPPGGAPQVAAGKKFSSVILIGFGGNLPSDAGPPEATCLAALAALQDRGVTVARRSRLYRTAPVPASAQPWFVNGVALLETRLVPADLLRLLREKEKVL